MFKNIEHFLILMGAVYGAIIRKGLKNEISRTTENFCYYV